jgi:hypothetical protein
VRVSLSSWREDGGESNLLSRLGRHRFAPEPLVVEGFRGGESLLRVEDENFVEQISKAVILIAPAVYT